MNKKSKSLVLEVLHYVALLASGVVPFALLTDSGTKLWLLTFSDDFRALENYCGVEATSAVNAFQHAHFWQIVVLGAMAWIGLIVFRIWLDRHVVSVCDENEKLERQNREFDVLSKNISSIFDWQMISIAKALQFTEDERISLYIADEHPDFLKCVARHSDRTSYKTCKRLYSRREGVIQRTLDIVNGQCWNLPKWKCDRYYKVSARQFSLSRATVDALTMHPRWIYGIQIRMEGDRVPNGVIVVESMRKDFASAAEVNALFLLKMSMLHDLINRFGSYAKSLHLP